MSIPNYVRPQHTIRQLLDQTAAATVGRINAIVVGPQYQLARYGVQDLPAVAFNSAGQTVPWQWTDSDGVLQTATGANVDLATARLYAEGLEALVDSNVGAGAENVTVTAAEPNVIALESGNNWKGGTLFTGLQGRAVKVGDIIRVTPSSGTAYRRIVTGFQGKAIAAHVGTNVALDDQYFTNGSYNPSTVAVAATNVLSSPTGGTLAVHSAASAFDVQANYDRGPLYNGQFGDVFYVTVLGFSGNAVQVRVTSASGLYAKSVVTSGDYAATVAGAYVIGTGESEPELGGLAIKITCTKDDATLIGQTGSFSAVGVYTRVTSAANNSIKTTGTYTGAVDTKIVLRVTAANTNTGSATGLKVLVSDTAGLFTPTEYTLTDSVETTIGQGLKIVADLSGGSVTWLRTGDIFTIEAIAATRSTTEFDKLVLNGPAVDVTVSPLPTITSVAVYVPYTGEIASDSASDDAAWEASANGIVIDSGMSLYDTEAAAWLPFANGVGSLYASFRELVVPSATEGILTIESVSDITSQLGDITLENELAYGANVALGAAQGHRIYALRVGGTDSTAWSAALAKTESTDMVYSFGVISDQTSVFDVVKTHVLAMSTETQKKFRRAYVSTESPGEYAKITTDEDGGPLVASFAGTDNKTLIAQVTPATDFDQAGLVAGDKVRVPTGPNTYDEFVIASVDSDVQLTLTAGPAVVTTTAVQLWKADTPQSQADYVKSVSRGLGTRRVANIWVEGGTKSVDGTITPIPVKFVACEVAGLRAALLPQQGLTRTEITAIMDANPMYTRYSQTLLDEVAAEGTFIITQDVESGAIYIRHQLTTDSSNGSLYYEDSVGVNLDNISFAIKDLLDGYIGRYNVTPATVAEIRNKVWHSLDEQTRTDFDTAVGPALIGFEDLSVAADSALKDRINVYAQLIMPLPLNNIVTTLRASVDVSL